MSQLRRSRLADGERRVLISEGGNGESRAAVAAVRALAAEGYRPFVTVCGDLSLAGASRYCMGRVPVPSASTDPQAYAAAVRAELDSGSYVALFPASDQALLALDFPVRHLMDKVACARAAQSVGLAVPPSQIFPSVAELLDAASELPYPVVVKPDIKRYMAARVDSAAALTTVMGARLDQPGSIIVQPYLHGGLHGVIGLVWGGRLVQSMHMHYHRIWPLPCGTVAAASTVGPSEELEDRLVALLDGFDGVFHADLAGPYLLDLNPRIHATLPLALASGINPLAAYCDLLRGCPVTPARSRAGVFFRWMEGDVRSVLHALSDGETGILAALRALAPHRGTVHSYESWRDPGPLWARVRFAARRLRRGRREIGAQQPLRAT
jgi:hypothetical protein